MNHNECLCCSCSQDTIDPHCRYHGFDGKRPCETHVMPGQMTELTNTPRMPESVEKKRRKDLPLFPEAKEQSWTGDDLSGHSRAMHSMSDEPSLVEKIMDTLAYYQCRETNPKADHPSMGYHAFSEEQRKFLQEKKREAAEEVERIVAAEIRKAKEQVWDEGFSAGYWDAKTPNPYSEEL